ncbi:LuxR C-terminal-related transcriptional regulator [Lysinibacillus boronitolerans]|uniref:LuxR C-terminal-related transcriptional regulator n=1 Tax=Lysinibacillus boronitolerans TaxID=309788 RepID=UPI0021629DDC|nr:LuxR C-terminal-related transcriptional regulator [Lysinibacillus boronitolerans]MCS1393588.1 LuxR C-terminal-related transcriptional regulator [Lysinibacillus boronitolerans]
MLTGQTQEIKKYMVDQWLKDYHWMVEQIRLGKMQNELAKDIEYDGAKVAAYGIEATLPKASGGTSDPVSYEATRRSQFYVKRVLRYEWKVREIQKRASNVTGEREIFVLNCILDGFSLRKIGQTMGLSEATIRRLKENILEMMLEVKCRI